MENQLNAQVTTIGSIGPENTVLLGFDFDTAGNLWGLGDTSPGGPSKVFTVDQSTGTATPGPDITGAPQGPTVSGLAIAPLTCPLPEPVVVQPTFTG